MKYKINNNLKSSTILIFFSILWALMPHQLRITPILPFYTLLIIILFFIDNFFRPIFNSYKIIWNIALSISSIIFLYFSLSEFEISQKLVVNFLCITILPKLLFIKDYRDVLFLFRTGLFLILTQFLFDQGIETAFYMMIGIFLFFASIIHKSSGLIFLSKEAIIRILKLIFLSMPIVVILFIYVPKTTKPMWSFFGEEKQKTGISEKMEYNEFNEIIQDNSIAFRVILKNQNMNLILDTFYWRYKTLDKLTDNIWTRSDNISLNSKKIDLDNINKGYEYEIILEPLSYNFLPVLDYSNNITNASINYDYSVNTDSNINTKKMYSAVSYAKPLFTYSEIDNKYLEYDESINPKMKQMAEKWTQSGLSKRELAQKVFNFYKEQEISYSLNPEINSSSNMLDTFLFEKKIGYCQLFASSSALLFRMLQIPSRVVIGFVGGEYNNVGDFIEVKNSDSHAWTEFYLPSMGWQRFDATNYAISLDENSQNQLISELPSTKISFIQEDKINFLSRIILTTKYLYHNASYKWDVYVIKEKYKKIKLSENKKILFILILTILLCLLIFLEKIRRSFDFKKFYHRKLIKNINKRASAPLSFSDGIMKIKKEIDLQGNDKQKNLFDKFLLLYLK